MSSLTVLQNNALKKKSWQNEISQFKLFQQQGATQSIHPQPTDPHHTPPSIEEQNNMFFDLCSHTPSVFSSPARPVVTQQQRKKNHTFYSFHSEIAHGGPSSSEDPSVPSCSHPSTNVNICTEIKRKLNRFSKVNVFFLNPLKHSFTISANEVDMTTKDRIRSHWWTLCSGDGALWKSNGILNYSPPVLCGMAAERHHRILLPIRTVQNQMMRCLLRNEQSRVLLWSQSVHNSEK